MNMKSLMTLGLLTLSACSSTPTHETPESQLDEVIASMNDESKPDWVEDMEKEPFKFDDGFVISLGIAEIPASNGRLSAAYKIADNDAKRNIASAVQAKLEFYFQHSAEGTDFDAQYSRSIGAESSKITSSHFRVHKRYWQKVAYTADEGSRLSKYVAYVTIKMPEGKFRQSIAKAMKDLENKKGLSDSFRKSVDAHWEKFVDTPAQREPNNRETASEE